MVSTLRPHTILAAAVLISLLGSASARGSGDVEFFEKKIRPLLAAHCYKCHSADAKKLKGNLRLDTKDAVLKGGDTGPALVAGDVEKSLLIKAVRYKDEDVQMPPDGKLSDAEIADLEAWVKMGAPDPRAGAPASGPAGGEGIDFVEGRKWWAFQPVKDVPAPEVKRADWLKSLIDRFILAKLEAQNLSPAPPAEKRALLRRAYYDVIGLPPTPAEVEAFIADESPDAFAKVVDHLLSLPQYGERWSRHWLDVVRYTDSLDSRGMDGESNTPFAWRYRDWVVNAFNQDLPYDQFVIRQIAGDLLPPKEPGRMDKEALVATGVYALGEWGIGDADKEKVVTDIVDDQVDLTGRAFLGLTLACARCHDHKFDPISTKDYYGMAGIFFSTRIMPSPGVKGAGAPIIRVPLLDSIETETRKADEARIAELTKQIESTLDEQYAKLAQTMLGQSDQYLAAAWEYKHLPAGGQPTVLQFAQQRNLNGYALSQWMNYIGSPTLKLLSLQAKNVNGAEGLNSLRNADGTETPVIYANKTDKPVQLPGALTITPMSLTLHPSATAGIAVAWKSPISGKVRVTGTVTDAHSACGDGVAWSVSRVGGAAAGELASGTIANGGTQALADGTGAKSLESVDIGAGEMIQLAVLPKADYVCDTTAVDFQMTEITAAGAGRTWNLTKEVVPDLHAGNPHPDAHGNAQVWHFHDMSGQAQSVYAAGSAMSKFSASLVNLAVADGAAVRGAAGEVRKTLEAVDADLKKLKAEGKDPATAVAANPDAAFHQTLTSPRGTFWAAARPDDSNLPAEAREQVGKMRAESSSLSQTIAQPVPVTHAMQDGGTPTSMFPGFQDVPVHIRGSYARLGELVPRRFPTVVAGDNQPKITQGSGRKELAAWIASPANPLTARVMANRIWQNHFGEGIVRTANNFGKLGVPPTHPELLDHLATRFMKLGWSMKALHREIMLSATYQQSSAGDAATMKADPENLLFGRMNRRRLDAEALRDSLLAATDKLDKTLGGPAINDLSTSRRTLYVMTIRSDRTTYRNLFDAADAGAIVEKRIDSTVAPQALFLLNNPFALAQTKLLAERAIQQPGDDAAKIDWLYNKLFTRPPTVQDLEVGKTGLAQARQPLTGEKVTPELAWETYCQVLLCTNEFIYVD